MAEFSLWMYNGSTDESGFVTLTRERLIDSCVAGGLCRAAMAGRFRSEAVTSIRKLWRESWNYHNEAMSEIQRRHELAQRAVPMASV